MVPRIPYRIHYTAFLRFDEKECASTRSSHQYHTTQRNATQRRDATDKVISKTVIGHGFHGTFVPVSLVCGVTYR